MTHHAVIKGITAKIQFGLDCFCSNMKFSHNSSLHKMLENLQKLSSDMESDYFVFKTQVSFAIATDVSEIEPSSITEDLQLNPSRMTKKGDTWIGKRTGCIGMRPRTAWTLDSEWTVLEEETICHHIGYFKTILLPKFDILNRYKEDDRFDVFFLISIHTDDAGIWLDLSDDDLAFLNDFSNRIAISLIVTTDVRKS